MTEYLHGFWLAVLQGITEFLPISSSGHLVLLPQLFGWEDQGLAFDVAVHVGSLIAVVSYFRWEIFEILQHWIKSLFGAPPTAQSRLGWYLLLTAAMVGVAGLFLESLINQWLRFPIPIAIATIFFALLLWWYDRNGSRHREINSLRWIDVVILGAAQVLALIPGTSRSGVTMTAGLALGLSRDAAARFSFLMAVPVIAMAGGWETRQLIYSATPVNWGVLVFAMVVSAVVAFACIHWFLGFLERFGMLPFVLYRLLLGVILLLLFL